MLNSRCVLIHPGHNSFKCLRPEIIVIYFSQCVTSGLLLFKRKIVLGMSNYPYAIQPRKNPKGLMMQIALVQLSTVTEFDNTLI